MSSTAIEAPQFHVRGCVIHKIRRELNYEPERKPVGQDKRSRNSDSLRAGKFGGLYPGRGRDSLFFKV